MGLLDGFKKVVGAVDTEQSLVQENAKVLAQYADRVKEINQLEEAYEKLSDEELKYLPFICLQLSPRVGLRLCSSRRSCGDLLDKVTSQLWMPSWSKLSPW